MRVKFQADEVSGDVCLPCGAMVLDEIEVRGDERRHSGGSCHFVSNINKLPPLVLPGAKSDSVTKHYSS
jgi:hypothetical protein